MKKLIPLILTICMVVTGLPMVVYAASSTPEISLEEFSERFSEMNEEYADEPVSNRLIVKSERKIDKLDSVDIVEGYDDLHFVQFDNSESAEQALEYYNDSKYIEYAEPDMILSVSEIETSNSITYDNHLSWGSSAIGVDDYFDYIGNVDILPEIIVGIIDTGIDLDHEFLKGRIIETGFNNSESGKNNSEDDNNGHGTHVAGIIVDNTTENVKVKAFKCLNSEGKGNLSNICIAVNIAVESDVDVINMSLGARGTSELLEDTINNAVKKGVTVCVAAGNNGQNAKNYTPANIENCITVGAINEEDQKPLWSNYGDAVDIWAPGSAIYSTYNNGTYETLSGTSMATPFVAAASSLLLSNNQNLKPNDIKDLIINNSRLLEDTFLDYELYALYIGVLSDYKGERTDKPLISIKGGIYLENITVEITCTDEGAEIYYSTNGKRASQDNGILYTKPITIDKVTTLNACAYKDGKIRSLQTSETYYIVTTDPDENFKIDEDGIITKYTGNNVYLSIPEKINGITVTGIGDNVFERNSINIIKFPDTLTYLGTNSFKNCRKLTSVYANSLTTIKDYSFYHCDSLKKIDISKVTFMGEYSFFNCYEIDTLYNDKVTEIKEGSFCGCDKLLYVELPNVNTIERNGFNGCLHIEMFILPNVEKIGERVFQQCLKITEFDLPNLKTINGTYTFAFCSNLTSINIPLIDGELPAYSFYNCYNIKEITLTNVTTIGNYAFYNCSSLESVNLPNVTNIGEHAFHYCECLKNINISNVQKISYQAFRDCIALRILYVPNVKTIESYTFIDDKIEMLFAPNITEVGEDVFTNSTYVKTLFMPKLKSLQSLSPSDTTLYCSDSLVTINIPKLANEYNHTFVSSSGSYAEQWANDNGYTFLSSDTHIENTESSNVTDLGRSICTFVTGLRFGFTWDNIDEIENLASNIEYGFVYSQKGIEDLSLDTVDGVNVKTITAPNRIDHGDTTSFNLVISNIPKGYQDREITARAYVCIDGMYFYSNTLKGSFEEVSNLVLADDEIDEATKDAVRKLLER